jgi:hypothetical protein
MGRRIRSQIACLVISVFLAGCAGSPATPSPQPTAQPTPMVTAQPTPSPQPTAQPTPMVTAQPTPSAAASVADITSFIPAGSYSAEVPAGSEAAPGKWLMKVSAAGIEWTNPENGSTFSPGAILEITGSSLVLAADPGCPDQTQGATTGSYDYRKEGSTFVFALVSDSCAGRRDTLTSSPWSPQP